MVLFQVKIKTDWDETLYILAEQLRMPVYKILEEMPLKEFLGWLRYYQNKNKPKAIDVTEFTPEQLSGLFNK